MILEFRVNKDILKKKDSPKVLDQSTDYYKLKFYPSKKIWKGCTLFATFSNDLGYIETVPLGEYNEILSCIVPPRIVKGGFFSLYICSDDNYKTNTISITLTNSYHKAKKKCNIISEVFAHIETKIDDIVYDNYQIKCYSGGELIDAIYIGNVDEDLVKDWIHEQMVSFKDTLADVAFTGSYNDLKDVPETFTPSSHSHTTEDIVNIDEKHDQINEELISLLTNEIDLI